MISKTSRVTIYDIAKKVGVSGSTVSRTLNNKGYVSQELHEIILTAAKEMGYTPNLAARSLKRSSTNQLMLSMNAVRDYYNFDVMESVLQEAKKKGYSVLFNYTGDDEEDELRTFNRLQQNYVDGLIMISLNFTEEHLRLIENVDYPVVLSSMSNRRFSLAPGRYDYVGVDTERGTYLSTQHLIGLGHQKVGYVGLPFRTQSWDERLRGYQRAMQDNGCAIHDAWVFTGGYDKVFGYQAGCKMVASKDLPTAICASTDMIAFGLYQAFEEHGIRIPEDVSIIGMDDTDICAMVRPKLTSVSIMQAEIGRLAAEIVLDRLNGDACPYQDVIFQPRLVLRDSCAPRKD